MKHRSLVLGAIALFVLGLFPVFGHAGCTASTITGTYGFSELGFAVVHPGTAGPSYPIAIAGTYTFNADGTVNRAFTLSSAGTIITVPNDSGTYTVNADCSGTAVFPNTPLGAEPFNLTIVGGGDAIHFMNTVTGIVLAGRMERQ